jgi:SAM-dependent methyltransferase
VSQRAAGRRPWTAANLKHAASFLRYGANPAATVYESLGAKVWLAPAPDWLNLGLWAGPGEEAEAPEAVRRLVATLAARLPRAGVVADVGCGLGVQDEVIAEVARPRALVALNITASQLRWGSHHLERAGASPVAGDACRLPLATDRFDGVISVEAAFHFASRASFFAEVARVLRPGGVLAMSDVSVERLPRSPSEAVAGLANLRFWGLRGSSMAGAEAIARSAGAAGLRDVRVQRCGDRVIPPAVAHLRRRLRETRAPAGQAVVARTLLGQWDLLYRNGVIDYLLVTASA